MGTYGRNFEFRIPPEAENRPGRYVSPTAAPTIPLGTPVATTGAGADAMGLLPVALVTAAGAPKRGACGIIIYEWAPAAFAGTDPWLTTYSDRDFAPLGEAVQVVSGPEVKVVFRNTTASTFLNNRNYTGRTMVAGMGATPTIAIDDWLTPGPGNDSGGYWQKTATEANAWLRVTGIDVARLEVEARFVF